MKSNGFKMLIVGVGGQGIVLVSSAIGQACAEGGVNVVTGEMYGLSQRSGSVYTHMRVGGTRVSPLIAYGEADAIIALEAQEALRYIEFLKDDGVILMNTRVINPPTETKVLSLEKRNDFVTLDAVLERLGKATGNIALIDALALANDAGNALTENAVLMGALSTLANFPLSIEDMKKGLERVVPQKALDANRKAFSLGQKAAFESLCRRVECRE